LQKNGVPLNDAAMAEYEALPKNTTPMPLIEASVSGRNRADVEALARSYFGSRDGYANTHDLPDLEAFVQTAVEGPEVEHDDPIADDEEEEGRHGRYMRGIDGIEMVHTPGSGLDAETTSPSPPPTGPTMPEPPRPPRPTHIHRRGDVLAVMTPSIENRMRDYDVDYLLKLHPSVFPHGVGKRPAGMSELVYFRLLWERYPLKQFGRNAGLLFDMFNIWQRHAVNDQARIRVRCNPHAISRIGNATVADLDRAVQVRGSADYETVHAANYQLIPQVACKRPSVQKKMMASMNPLGRTLVRMIRQMSPHVPGGPQSKGSFRAKAMASPIVNGPATCMINVCPSELSAAWVFVIGDDPTDIKFNHATGACIGRPANARDYVAANFWGCADFFWAYMRAFNKFMLGWSLDETVHKQEDPNCLFGIILAWMWSFEESTRGGIHGHGLITMPLLQAQRLRDLCNGERGWEMQRRLIEFAETIACAMMPQVGPNPVRHPIFDIVYLLFLMSSHSRMHLGTAHLSPRVPLVPFAGAVSAATCGAGAQ